MNIKHEALIPKKRSLGRSLNSLRVSFSRLAPLYDVEDGGTLRAMRFLSKVKGAQQMRAAQDDFVRGYPIEMMTIQHYADMHALLEYYSRGNYKGKRILSLGAATGTYVRFLQRVAEAKAVGVDINKHFVDIARERGTKRMHTADVLPKKKAGLPHLLSTKGRFTGGAWVPQRHVGMRFRRGTFDFVLSEHLLFADYHNGVAANHYNESEYIAGAPRVLQPGISGFETRPGSIARSEEALEEVNRVLKRGGYAIIENVHGDDLEEALKHYRRGAIIKGFMVENTFNHALQPSSKEIYAIVLRKVSEATID